MLIRIGADCDLCLRRFRIWHSRRNLRNLASLPNRTNCKKREDHCSAAWDITDRNRNLCKKVTQLREQKAKIVPQLREQKAKIVPKTPQEPSTRQPHRVRVLSAGTHGSQEARSPKRKKTPRTRNPQNRKKQPTFTRVA
jgi:hypothetical protein